MRFTAIDFETANADRGSACAVGLVVVEEGRVISRTCQLIRPEPCHFDPFNVSIHGISAADVINAPRFSEFWPQLWAQVSGPLVAHNAAFDMSVLRRSLDREGLPYPETDYFCTRVISKLAWPQHPTYALDYIASVFGIRFRHHDAAEDAQACALVALQACRDLSVSSLHDLQGVVGLRVGKLSSSGHCPCGGPHGTAALSAKRKTLRASDIGPSVALCAEAHPYCGLNFVFTGALLSMPRKDAMQAVVDRGGFCHDSLNSEVNCLVVGQKGFIGYENGHKSSKMVRAEQMRSAGYPIEILSEDDFLAML